MQLLDDFESFGEMPPSTSILENLTHSALGSPSIDIHILKSCDTGNLLTPVTVDTIGRYSSTKIARQIFEQY